MRILITGGKGQLGRCLTEALVESGSTVDPAGEVYVCGRQELDITNLAQTQAVIAGFKPEVVIHAAAATGVDACEEDPDKAYLVNAVGTRNVAVAAAQVGAKLLYVSTDYVFAGDKGSPYWEYDSPRPLNIYGASKLAGEEYVRTLHPRHFIVRTSWLWSGVGKSFLRSILLQARQGKELKVVDDQIGSPTYAPELAQALLFLVQTDGYGTYHLSNQGECSWYEFARFFLERVAPAASLTRISTAALGRPAPRPAYSVLRSFLWEKSMVPLGGPVLSPWQETVERFIADGVAST